MQRTKALILAMCIALATMLSAALRVQAQAIQTTGQPCSPAATTTVDGRYLPNPPAPFGGEINLDAKNSKPCWAPQIVPPKGAPNILLIMTDDAGYGISSTFGGVIPTPVLACGNWFASTPKSVTESGAPPVRGVGAWACVCSDVVNTAARAMHIAGISVLLRCIFNSFIGRRVQGGETRPSLNMKRVPDMVDAFAKRQDVVAQRMGFIRSKSQIGSRNPGLGSRSTDRITS